MVSRQPSRQPSTSHTTSVTCMSYSSRRTTNPAVSGLACTGGNPSPSTRTRSGSISIHSTIDVAPTSSRAIRWASRTIRCSPRTPARGTARSTRFGTRKGSSPITDTRSGCGYPSRAFASAARRRSGGASQCGDGSRAAARGRGGRASRKAFVDS